MQVPVKIDAKVGERSTEKLMDAVIDTFSPATEFLGLLGDSVRLARVNLAAKVTLRAKQIADENGLKLTAPPLKFLVPFYEKASIEDPENDTLVEMWARLLTTASTQGSERHVRFTSILSEIGKTQADIFDKIANNWNMSISDIDEADLFYQLQAYNVSNTIKELKSLDTEGAIDELVASICSPGMCLVMAFIDPKDPTGNTISVHDDLYSDKISIELQMLSSLGLLVYINTGFVTCKAGDLLAELYCFTELGYEFWKACRFGGKITNKGTAANT